VSKPTVYNHFPDKAALMLAVVNRWSDLNKPQIMRVNNMQALDEFIRTRWLTDEAVKFYAIVIGEGWRFPEAKQLFWSQFDRLWRKALSYVSDHSENLDPQAIELHLDHQLLRQLRDR
jgi:TetR/AcrR family transcriptional regulator of autoinduction and epiphytic fitness